MLRLHRALTKTRQVNVLDVVGSAGKGVIIRLFLRRPTLLVDMLEQMPEVQEAFESHTLKPELRISKRTKSSLLVIDMVMAIAR